MNSKFKFIIASMLLFAFTATLNAQDQIMIYGTVNTIDGDSYTGQIRWGKEEAFWTDLFNGTKEENENYKYLSRDDRDDLRDSKRNRMRWGNRWVSWSNDWESTHEFQARFGDISKIEINRRSEVKMTLRNGETIYVQDGSNDFGTDVHVMDPELGKTSFRWSRIESIEFAAANAIENKMGEPLYGTVEFYGGQYTGFIQWDHDERLSTDILDGDTRDGDLKIEFGNIESIERERGGSNVVTKSGRDLYLRGSNDVNGENRGIIVTTAFGRVDIPWREFKKVTFQEASGSFKGYNDYSNISKLSGTVKTTDGRELTGQIIYDLDEEYSFEMLQGKDDDVEYILPMESVKSISPKNYDYSQVVLKTGEELVLGDARDVDENNDGVLVFTGGDDPVYVAWEDIEIITFK